MRAQAAAAMLLPVVLLITSMPRPPSNAIVELQIASVLSVLAVLRLSARVSRQRSFHASNVVLVCHWTRRRRCLDKAVANCSALCAWE
jgi:hypothetical protein